MKDNSRTPGTKPLCSYLMVARQAGVTGIAMVVPND